MRLGKFGVNRFLIAFVVIVVLVVFLWAFVGSPKLGPGGDSGSGQVCPGWVQHYEAFSNDALGSVYTTASNFSNHLYYLRNITDKVLNNNYTSYSCAPGCTKKSSGVYSHPFSDPGFGLPDDVGWSDCVIPSSGNIFELFEMSFKKGTLAQAESASKAILIANATKFFNSLLPVQNITCPYSPQSSKVVWRNNVVFNGCMNNEVGPAISCSSEVVREVYCCDPSKALYIYVERQLDVGCF